MTSPTPTPPSGPAWAALLAAAIGCFAFGLTVIIAETFPRISHALNLYNPTGDLSGKSSVAVLTWLTAWFLLHSRWSKRDLRSPALAAFISVILVVLAFVAVLPPVVAFFATR